MWRCLPWLRVPSFLLLFDEKWFKHPLRHCGHRYLLCSCFSLWQWHQIKVETHDCSCCEPTFIFPTSPFTQPHTLPFTHVLDTQVFQFAYLCKHDHKWKVEPCPLTWIWWIPSLLRVEKIFSPFALLASSIQNSTWLNHISAAIWIKDLD